MVLTREIQFCEWFLYGLQIELGTEKPQIAPHLPFGRDVFHSKWLLWLADRANSIGWDLWNRYWHRCKNTFVLTAKYLFPQCLVRVGFFHDQPNGLKKNVHFNFQFNISSFFSILVILFEFVAVFFLFQIFYLHLQYRVAVLILPFWDRFPFHLRLFSSF